MDWNSPRHSNYRAWGIGLALAGILGFSLRPVWIKLAYAAPALDGPVSPVTLLFLRMVLTLPFFAITGLLLRDTDPPMRPRDWWAVTWLGFMGYYVASLLDFIGLQYVDAGVGRLILFLYPTIVLLLSFLLLRHPPSRLELVALVISYVGIALVLLRHLDARAGSERTLLGAFLIFTAALCFAVYLVVGSQLVKRIGSMRFTAYTMMMSTPPAVFQFVATEPLSALELPAIVWVYAILLATLSTVLPVFLQAEALKRIGANQFALLGAAGPVATAVAGVLGLEESFSPLQVMGAALVIIGVLLVSLRSK